MTAAVATPPSREVLTPTNFAGLPIKRSAGTKNTYINMLIYGESGVGKTWLAGSSQAVPSMRNVLYVDAESGRKTLDQAWPGVPILKATRWQDYIEIYVALLAGGHDYQTVVLDSMSEMLEHCKEQVMVEMKADPENDGRDEDVPSIREWGKILARMMRITRRFRDLPMNVIFIAHAEQVKDKDGRTKWMPLVNGKFQMKLPQIPDVVLFMYVKPDEEGNTRRLLLTQQTNKAVAKVRGAIMPMVIGEEQDPTMAEIMEYYTSTKVEKKA
jgi:phage nucleotide-binding protein